MKKSGLHNDRHAMQKLVSISNLAMFANTCSSLELNISFVSNMILVNRLLLQLDAFQCFIFSFCLLSSVKYTFVLEIQANWLFKCSLDIDYFSNISLHGMPLFSLSSICFLRN